MNVQNTNKQTFTAKFLYSDSLKRVADYAVKHNQFDRLNQARKNIDNVLLTTRVKLDISESANGRPVVSFTTYKPKKSVLVAYSFDDYVEVKKTTYAASKNCNPFKFALEKIIKLGNSAPKNKMYKTVIK